MALILAVTGIHATIPSSIEIIDRLLGFTPSIEGTLAFCLLLIAVERLVIIENSLAHPTKLFAEQQDVYTALKEYVVQHGVREAVFLQYSCSTALDLLRVVVRAGAKVTLYLQSPSTPRKLGSSYQHDRVRTTHAKLPSELKDLQFEKNVRIYEYDPPASVSAVRIDDKLISVGWSITKNIESTSYAEYPIGDTVEMLAHNVPAILARRGSAEYDTLNTLFRDLCENFKAGKKPSSPLELRDRSGAPARGA
jgi:hypothetical protein